MREIILIVLATVMMVSTAAESAAKPTAKSAAKSAAESAAKPITESAAESASGSNAKTEPTTSAVYAPETSQNPLSIKVSGVVYSKAEGAPQTLIVNECDICEKSKRCIVELDSAGRFDVCVPFYYGHTFTVNYNRNLFINAYAEPGDSIFVSIDAAKSPVEFHLSGDRSRLNEEYSHAFLELAPKYYEVQLPPDTVALSEYMPAFKREVSRIQTTVDRHIEEKSLLPETAELLRLDNIFTVANMAIGYRGNGIDEQTAFFTDSLFDILNERNTRVMIFPYHLSALMNKNPEYVNTVPKSMIRDLMYAARDEGETPSRNDFVNTAYYDRLFAQTKSNIDFSGLKPGDWVVMENDTISTIQNVNPVEWIKKRFASRPVYVDVSATWCGPCRATLANTEDIRRYFKDSDIIFAVIWLKSDMESWKRLAPAIRNATHIFIPDEDMANRMMGILNMQGFPSYFFIDRTGEIYNKDIPHLNDPGLVEFLNTRKLASE